MHVIRRWWTLNSISLVDRAVNAGGLATVLIGFVTKIGFPTTAAASIGDNESIQIWHVEQP